MKKVKISHNQKAVASKAGKQGHIASHMPAHMKSHSLSKKVKGC